MPNILTTQINAYIQKHKLIPAGSRIIIGLSGGPDSVFLLHFLNSLKEEKSLTLFAAHLDHEWRANSHEDVLFCEQACAALGIPFFSAKLSELSFTAKPNGSKEEYARKARRAFFEKIKQEQEADLIALAHHQQDQQETFFIRLMRGATATGLTCMRPKDGSYIRPLLETDKAEILAYLEQHTIAYVIDPSNNSHDFLRNRIRHTVLPALYQSDKRFEHNMKRAIAHLQETESFLAQLTHTLFAQLTTREPITTPQLASTSTPETHDQVTASEQKKLTININFFNVTFFLSCAPFMQQRLLMRWLTTERVPFTPSHALLQEIARFLEHAESTSHVIHPAWRIIKQKSGTSGKKETWAYIEKTISR